MPVAPGKAYGKVRGCDTSGKTKHQLVLREDEKEDTHSKENW